VECIYLRREYRIQITAGKRNIEAVDKLMTRPKNIRKTVINNKTTLCDDPPPTTAGEQ
jgi:hypothetical protein